MDEQFYNMMEQYAFAVTLPVPENENEWRKIVKDPSRFVAKKLKLFGKLGHLCAQSFCVSN